MNIFKFFATIALVPALALANSIELTDGAKILPESDAIFQTAQEFRALMDEPVVVNNDADAYVIQDRGGPNNLQMGYVGETYIGIGLSKKATSDKCENIAKTVKAQMVDERFSSKRFVYDYLIFCQEMQKGLKTIFAVVLVEPHDQSEVKNLQSYVLRLKDQPIEEVKLHIAKIKAFEVEKQISALHIPNLDEPKPLHRYDMVSTKTQRFDNFHQYRMHVLLEKRKLANLSSLRQLKELLAQYLHPKEMEIFESNGLMKSNVILIGNARRDVFMNNYKLDAMTTDSAIGLCENFSSGLCMKE